MGDILLVRLRNGDPFAGVCLNIRRRGVDTGILLRNQLTRVGVEMWFKIYSPNVEGVEVVQRRAKRARRARLYYMRYVRMGVTCFLCSKGGVLEGVGWVFADVCVCWFRKPEHDMGSVQNIVQQYLRQRAVLRSGDGKGRDANAGKRKGGKKR